MNVNISRSMIPSAGSLPSRFFVGPPGSGDDWVRERYRDRKDVWIPDTKLVLAMWPDAIDLPQRRTVPRRTTSTPPPRQPSDGGIPKQAQSSATLAGRLMCYLNKTVPGIEISPEYYLLSEDRILGLRALLPGARFLCFIRDPVDLAIDRIQRQFARRIQLGQFWGSWSLIEEDPSILPACDYQSFVQRWAHALPPHQLQFLGHRGIVETPGLMGSIIDEFFALPAPDRRNRQRSSCRNAPKAANEISASSLILRDRFEARLRHVLAPQYDFLREFFGDRFMRTI